MSACLVFVFAALLEYAVVNVLSRRRGGRTSGANGGFLGSLPPLAATGLPLGPPSGGGCASSAGICTATAAGFSGDGILTGCRRQQAPPGTLSLLHPIKKLETEARYDQASAHQIHSRCRNTIQGVAHSRSLRTCSWNKWFSLSLLRMTGLILRCDSTIQRHCYTWQCRMLGLFIASHGWRHQGLVQTWLLYNNEES